MLAKILSQRHGFKCTVLFSVDADGTINPKNGKSLSNAGGARHGRCHRDVAALPRLAGRGHGALRQGAASREADRRAAHEHARLQRIPEGQPWETWNYNNQGGFGKRVLGETWLTHWGRHKIEATRGAIDPAAASQPAAPRHHRSLRRHRRLRGLSAGRRNHPRPGRRPADTGAGLGAGRLPEDARDRQAAAGRQRPADAGRVDAPEQERQRHDEHRF